MRTVLFAEPRTTLPAALFHVWGKAVCSKLGTVIKYHGFLQASGSLQAGFES